MSDTPNQGADADPVVPDEGVDVPDETIGGDGYTEDGDDE
jgi:hypothetical protein